MSNLQIFILLLIIGFMNIFLKTIAVFLGKEPNNRYIKKFFEYMPISVLTYLVFPDIFSSVGNTKQDFYIILFVCSLVIYFCIKNIKLYKILFLSTFIIILLKIIFLKG